jgi:two-component system, NarL family, invasion response regulator UvrY
MKVLIADDHVIVREGIKKLLHNFAVNTLIDEAKNGVEALEKIKNTQYDLVILDISMPRISGLDVLQKLITLNINCRALMLSFHPQEQYAIRAFKLGASGYVSKGSGYEELKQAIQKVVDGGFYAPPELAEKILFGVNNTEKQFPHENLSEREFQVMLLLAKGNTVTTIADMLYLSVNTISTYRSRIKEKMGLKNNCDFTMYAYKHSLIE